MKKIYYWLTFLSIGFVSWAQPTVKTIAQPNSIKIGQQFTYIIKATPTKKAIFNPLLLPQDVVVVKKNKPLVVGNTIQQKYVLTCFKVGLLVLPPQKVKINQRWYQSTTTKINVTSIPIDEKRILMNERVRFYEQEAYTLAELWYQYQWIIWLLLFVALLVWGIIKYLKNRPAKYSAIKEELSPYLLAIDQIQQLNYQKLWQKQMVKNHYDELSMILRNYIAQETTLQSLESTSNELLMLIKNYHEKESLGFNEIDFKNLEAFLIQSDFVKFAKQVPSESEIFNHTTLVIGFIEKIHQSKNKSKATDHEIL